MEEEDHQLNFSLLSDQMIFLKTSFYSLNALLAQPKEVAAFQPLNLKTETLGILKIIVHTDWSFCKTSLH